MRTAAAVPSRVKAAASFHGGGLVTDKPDSPHRLLASTTASYLIAVARNDDARAPADKDTFRAAAQAAGRPAEVEVYAADHGWCTLDAPIYDKAEAERAWGADAGALRGALSRASSPLMAKDTAACRACSLAQVEWRVILHPNAQLGGSSTPIRLRLGSQLPSLRNLRPSRGNRDIHAPYCGFHL